MACLAVATPAPAQTDAVDNVERRVVDVKSRRGLTQKLIVTRPLGTTRRLPAILFLPWMNCDSLSIPEGRRHGAQIIVKHLVEQPGFVVGRIEKPGVGGSAGVCADIDFDTELAAYQAAFQHLETDQWVEPRGLIVAAQSFSGGVVPLVSQGRPVRGYLVMSTWVRTWFERLIEFERLRLLQAKTAPAVIARRMRQYAELYAIYLNQGLTPGEVIARRPDLTAVWEGSGTHQYGRAAAFFHQLQALNLEDEWSRVSTPTLAMWGDQDIAMHRIDHERIVALVNANQPGAATLRVVPGAGHDLAVGGTVPADVLEAIDTWLQRVAAGPPANWPAPRSGAHAMAYDSKRGLTMLYGDRGPDASVLWAWDGNRWQSFDTPGPGLRRHIKLAYDPARDRLVLYGGYDDAGLNIRADTWEWDGRRWHEIRAAGPGPRSSYSLVYDPLRRKIVLFGGLSTDGVKNDTWTWDGAAWAKAADTGPEARGEAGAVFDPANSRVVLSSGMAYERRQLANGRTSFALRRDRMPQDVWAWNGTRWRVLARNQTARMAPLAIDPLSGELRRIGGESNDGSVHGDMSRWDGKVWTVVAGITIPARHGAAVAQDTKRRRLVLFGGFVPGTGALDDLWEFDGQQWLRRLP